MAALVQSYSQQSGTATMLQSRGAAAPSMIAVGQPSPNHPYAGVPTQAPRSAYSAASAASPYRGSTVPSQPYAFSSMPNMSQGLQWQHQQHPIYRTSIPSAIPTAPSIDTSTAHRSHRQHSSVTNMALLTSYATGHGSSRDDLTIPQPRMAAASQLRQPQGSAVSKRSSQHSGQPGRIAASSQLSPVVPGKSSQPNKSLSTSRSAPNLSVFSHSIGDANIHRRASPDESMRRRRRSIYSIEATDTTRPALKGGDLPRTESANSAKNIDKSERTPRIVPLPPKVSSHHRNASSDSVSSSRSNHSRTPSGSTRGGQTVNGNLPSNASDEIHAKSGQPKTNAPLRGSPTDSAKRTMNPSPLSKPATMAANESKKDIPSQLPAPAPSSSSGNNLSSPAAKQLAALNQKGAKPKSKTSRLRRAFSFGSAAELRAAASASESKDSSESSRTQKDATPEQSFDAEQARIAEAQEAGGIGSNIYGGRYFNSTDNLSISSTASSASIMIRKMGRGVKSRTRSLVGLFRPKVATGGAAAESSAPETSEPTVSMVHVEAEAQRVNVTTDLRDAKAGKGGIGYPHLERNSLDANQVPDLGSERLGSSSTETSASRKSIVGGDRERAEVLAAVRKGILKRATSPSVRPIDSPDLVLPGVPTISDSPNSSTPSTPVDDAQGHRRVGSIAIGNEDYFMSALRLRHDSKSRPESPQAVAKRNATFSPRIIFYDTWPSQEYDRRGEIATCNRLTPMLAQQIKEELNSFKMEMEVHENSKIYTHFF